MPPFKTLQTLLPASLQQRIKHLARWSISRVLTSLGMVVESGAQSVDASKPTVIVVSHEASTTGAPILALNLTQQLSSRHNVVVILLRGGVLKHQFQASSTAVIEARRSIVNRKLVRRALAKASSQTPEFALVNSVVSAPILEPLRGEGIACLSLVHEFVTYIKPLDVFSEVGLWSSRVVCSTSLTWSDVLQHCTHLNHVPLAVLPQGRCELPPSDTSTRHHHPKRQKAKGATENFLRRLPPQTLLVLGAGAVQPRKGVDLFVAIAALIKKQAPDLDVRFAWIGSGYDPEHDLSVSIWLQDQILRSGLEQELIMLDESPAYRDVIQRSDLFIVSSRLDPLPNVAIDAMQASKPVLCFDQACGIAGLLGEQPFLHEACVASYFDCTEMANKALNLLHAPDKLKQLGELTKENADRWFDMPNYINELIKLAAISSKETKIEESDAQVLAQEALVNASFAFPDKPMKGKALHQRYLLSWCRNVRPRKPFPGFHPGIYRDHQLSTESNRDPLVHWHQQGKPSGPWLVPVIQPGQISRNLPDNNTVALHIHVFYPELLDPILECLGHNKVQPDLFISFSDTAIEADIDKTLRKFKRDASLHRVPNRGRDIAPLLSELGCQLDRDYTIHGHLHTKKSVLIDGGTAARWREFLLANLLGTQKVPMADAILSAIHNDPDLGLVFPDDPGCLGWTDNRSHAEVLGTRLGLSSLPDSINFPVGTMFWARKGALSKLYELGFSWQDYPDEPLGYDGTMLHAIERLLPQICLASGKHYAVTHVPGFSR